MTDYRELKRLAEACSGVSGSELIGARVRFHHAAKPKVVLALIADVNGLRTIAYGVSGAHRVEMYDEIARLKGEVEALRKDADRFRFIEQDASSGMSKIYGDDWVSVIDAAMTKGAKP